MLRLRSAGCACCCSSSPYLESWDKLAVWRTCTGCVFGAFKRFERLTDRFTGAAGPVFVLFAAVLIVICVATFFDVVFPHRFLGPDHMLLTPFLGGLWCGWIVLMFVYHYYKAITIKPGRPIDPPRTYKRPWIALLPSSLCATPFHTVPTPGQHSGRRQKAIQQILAAQQKANTASSSAATEASAAGSGAHTKGRYCKKCPDKPPKPERTHHCSVCKHCILKFDHHCPWINSCVGLHNERYFLLFMCYFSVGCACVVWWGWTPVLSTFHFEEGGWPHRTPRSCTLLLWAITFVMFLAVGVMAIQQLRLVAAGETTVEAHDNEWYAKIAKAANKQFKNPYNLGRRRNLAVFFNIDGSHGYPWWTILLPVEIPPASDGWQFEKIRNWEQYSFALEEQLTDEEMASDDE